MANTCRAEELFGLDMLVNMLAAAGLRVKVQVKKAA